MFVVSAASIVSLSGRVTQRELYGRIYVWLCGVSLVKHRTEI